MDRKDHNITKIIAMEKLLAPLSKIDKSANLAKYQERDSRTK